MFPFFDEIPNSIITRIKGARKSIKIVNPYYTPMEVLDDELIRAVERGVEVTFIVPQKRDIPFYKIYNNMYLMRKLGEHGVKIYEYDLNFLHAKGILFDDEIINIGSLNLDSYSWFGNNEVNIEIHRDAPSISQFQQEFNELLKICKKVSFQELLSLPGYI